MKKKSKFKKKLLNCYDWQKSNDGDNDDSSIQISLQSKQLIKFCFIFACYFKRNWVKVLSDCQNTMEMNKMRLLFHWLVWLKFNFLQKRFKKRQFESNFDSIRYFAFKFEYTKKSHRSNIKRNEQKQNEKFNLIYVERMW